MKSLLDFPYHHSQSFRLKSQLSDEQLQDVCNSICTRVQKLVHPNSTNPKVSVVFPAYNEEMYLPLMLWTLSKMTPSVPIEIIGVNNASSDRTGEIMNECGIIKVDENIKGVSYARQAGLEASKGEIIATTDADTQVPERWIDTNVQYFENDPQLACLSGGVSFELHPSHKILRLIPQLIRHICFTEKERPYIPFSGANTFYKKSAAMEVGGYEKGFNLGEDNLLAQKMSKNGNIAQATHVDTRVHTSDRRLNSTLKVLKLYASNFTRVNWIDRNKVTVSKAYNFSDIR